jgi:hypothetical protein
MKKWLAFVLIFTFTTKVLAFDCTVTPPSNTRFNLNLLLENLEESLPAAAVLLALLSSGYIAQVSASKPKLSLISKTDFKKKFSSLLQRYIHYQQPNLLDSPGFYLGSTDQKHIRELWSTMANLPIVKQILAQGYVEVHEPGGGRVKARIVRKPTTDLESIIKIVTKNLRPDITESFYRQAYNSMKLVLTNASKEVESYLVKKTIKKVGKEAAEKLMVSLTGYGALYTIVSGFLFVSSFKIEKKSQEWECLGRVNP